jgi:hypothetical protein
VQTYLHRNAAIFADNVNHFQMPVMTDAVPSPDSS